MLLYKHGNNNIFHKEELYAIKSKTNRYVL